jgi:lysophospholipase L1-like esterase
MKKLFKTMLIILATAAVMAQFAFAAPVFKSGDRVVIYGDSITEQQLYSRYIQQYIQCRYPEMKIRFFNAGWGGDTATGALNRLQRDVLFLKPTVVTLFFGMNDGSYTKINQEIIANYRANMEKLIKALLAKKIRVVVFTPGCVDYDRNAGLADVKYNEMLEALGTNALDLAKKYKCQSADVFHPMLKFQTAQKAISPQFTMIPDSVHPNAAGHEVMAYTMLQGLGAEPMPAIGDIDLTSGTANGLKLISQSVTKIVIETTKPIRAPYWFAPDAAAAVQASGFINLTAPELKISGLNSSYKLSIDGELVGSFTADQFAAGVKIPGNYSEKGRRIHEFIANKEATYFNMWRNMRLGLLGLSAIKEIEAKSLELDNSIHQYILQFATPAKAKITLER